MAQHSRSISFSKSRCLLEFCVLQPSENQPGVVLAEFSSPDPWWSACHRPQKYAIRDGGHRDPHDTKQVCTGRHISPKKSRWYLGWYLCGLQRDEERWNMILKSRRIATRIDDADDEFRSMRVIQSQFRLQIGKGLRRSL